MCMATKSMFSHINRWLGCLFFIAGFVLLLEIKEVSSAIGISFLTLGIALFISGFFLDERKEAAQS